LSLYHRANLFLKGIKNGLLNKKPILILFRV
jgi:hypothetical protein